MIVKQNQHLNFAQGLDTKTDEKQVQFGKFLKMENSIFQKGGLFQKRNGYGQLTALTSGSPTDVTTFNGDLTAIGTTIQAYSLSSAQWITKGSYQPITLNTQPIIRNNTNQSQADSAVANGLVITVYTDQNPANLATNIYKYVVTDQLTGQNIVAPTQITAADPVFGAPKVYVLNHYFIILFSSSTSHIQYIAVTIANPSLATAPADISSSYTPATTGAFDAVPFNNALYIAWNGASASGVKMAALSYTLVVSSTVNPDPTHPETIMSVTADPVNNLIWATYFDAGTVYTLAVTLSLITFLPPTLVVAAAVLNIASTANAGILAAIYEVSNNYSYDASIPTHFISRKTVTQSGVVGAAAVVSRSVGLASRSFFLNNNVYFLAAFQSPYQPSYFLMDILGHVVMKLAYSNGGGYLTHGLPNVNLSGDTVYFPYLFKDSIAAVNKDTNVPAGTQVAGVYSQLGINLASVEFAERIVSSEIGNNLNLTGGFLWGYDGYALTEQDFFVWPDSVEVTTSATGGLIPDGTYFYQAVYEWTDNQGNAFRSAPSIPVSIVASGGGTTANTVNVPTLRLTYKLSNPVKLVLYRWGIAQQIYYQVTSITAPILNDPTIDSIAIVDTQSNAAILGNNIIYTNGGVVEDLNGPATNITTLFDDRLWLVDAEDQNLLWYSKQVIEATPVEMSDLFTVYVAPTIGSQLSTGPMTALSAMDDKLIIFKRNAIYYINGSGPDNTGANSQYSQPIYITATVGCHNPQSVILIPSGIMFQSDKGIWLLGRDLSTSYIGAPVERFNGATVQSSVSIPGTNQVRFTLDSGITLMYDYYYGQWGTFTGVPAISSTLYQDLHTFINVRGEVYQESPGLFLDGSNPVLMSFTTSWLNLSGIQGYQRAFFFYLLGQYLTPHKLMCEIAYDYNPAPSQGTLITPDNFAATYGGPESNGQETVYGQDTPYGGPGDVENWRIFLDTQRCTAFQISVHEVYDPTFNVPAGAGLTLTGINLVYGTKKGWIPISAANSAGVA